MQFSKNIKTHSNKCALCIYIKISVSNLYANTLFMNLIIFHKCNWFSYGSLNNQNLFNDCQIAQTLRNKKKCSMLSLQTWPMAYYDSVEVYVQAMQKLLEVEGYNLTRTRHNCAQRNAD